MGTLTSPPLTSKPVIQSTQNWANAGMAAALAIIAASWPSAANFLTSHPLIAPTALSIVNILWRTFITKQPISGIV